MKEQKTSVPSASERMKTVKAACDKAPSGPKKEAALKHYQAAEKAQKASNETDCLKSCNEAAKALN